MNNCPKCGYKHVKFDKEKNQYYCLNIACGHVFKTNESILDLFKDMFGIDNPFQNDEEDQNE